MARLVIKVAGRHPRWARDVREFGMNVANDRFLVPDGERRVALDWATIGGAVRREAILAVALHFAEVAASCDDAWSGSESDRELLLSG